MDLYKHWLEVLDNPHVRDLAWALFSPNLLDSSCGVDVMEDEFLGVTKEAQKNFTGNLKQLDLDPKRLLTLLQEVKPQKLGDYFEALILFWLQQLSCCYKIEQGLLIKEERKTFGELDFVFFSDALASNVHYEVAVKFFLLNGDWDDFGSYIGPNPIDTLEKKIITLRKQLSVFKRPQAKLFLEQQKLLPLVAQALVKGYIFYPLKKDATFEKTPTKGISKDHLSGWWARLEDSSWKERALPYRLLPLDRLEWLSPRRFPKDDTEFLQKSMTVTGLRPIKPPSLIALFLQKDEWWEEQERGFLVSREWPKG
jgi:uncharacterized protein